MASTSASRRTYERRPEVVQLGVVLQTDPPVSRVLELARLAESNGFTHGWTFDSHVLWQEPFVIYSLMLAETERMVVGPMVSNPGTRDWTVLASMFATLDQHFGPRTVLGIGRGDSALRVIGRSPISLGETTEAIRVIKGLVAGEQVDYKDTPVRFPWVTDRAGATYRCGSPPTGPGCST